MQAMRPTRFFSLSSLLRLSRLPGGYGLRYLRRAALPVLAFMALAVTGGCYVPDKFVADVELGADGAVDFRYKGELVQIQLLQKIGRDQLEGEALAKEVMAYENSIRRDSAFKSVIYVGRGRYKVNYHLTGNMAKLRQITFPDRRSRFLGLRVREDGLLELFGNRAPAKLREQLIAAGFKARGVLRLIVGGEVLDHNAANFLIGEPSIFEWEFNSLDDPTPRLLMVPSE